MVQVTTRMPDSQLLLSQLFSKIAASQGPSDFLQTITVTPGMIPDTQVKSKYVLAIWHLSQAGNRATAAQIAIFYHAG